MRYIIRLPTVLVSVREVRWHVGRLGGHVGGPRVCREQDDDNDVDMQIHSLNSPPSPIRRPTRRPQTNGHSVRHIYRRQLTAARCLVDLEGHSLDTARTFDSGGAAPAPLCGSVSIRDPDEDAGSARKRRKMENVQNTECYVHVCSLLQASTD